MAKPAKFILVTLLCCLTLTSTSQLTLQKDFTLSKAPRTASRNWFKLNHGSAHYFRTNVEDGHLKITRTDFIDSIDFNISTGRLVGIDNGEWGGVMKFIPRDSTLTHQVVAYGNICFIFSFAGNIYYIDALAHGRASSGSMYRLDTFKQKFSSTKVISFEDAPEAMTIWNNRILIAAHESFFVVDDQLNKTKIVTDSFWGSLYPTSVGVVDEEHVFIGMRGGIVELNLITRTFNFYRYNGIKFSERPVDYDTPMYDLNE